MNLKEGLHIAMMKRNVSSGTKWMNLFIDSDCNAVPGWYGYDFVLNRAQDDRRCSVMKFSSNTWGSLVQVGEADQAVNAGDMLTLYRTYIENN